MRLAKSTLVILHACVLSLYVGLYAGYFAFRNSIEYDIVGKLLMQIMHNQPNCWETKQTSLKDLIAPHTHSNAHGMKECCVYCGDICVFYTFTDV